MTVPFALYAMYLAPTMTLIHSCVDPVRRSTASALFLFVINIVGTGGGALFVGWLSHRLERVYGTGSLQIAMTALTPFFLAAAGLFYFASRAVVPIRQPAVNIAAQCRR
jgi:hypothetical protein